MILWYEWVAPACWDMEDGASGAFSEVASSRGLLYNGRNRSGGERGQKESEGETMTAEQNKATVRRIYKEYLDELDPKAADELLADDVVLHGARAFGEGSGREELTQGFIAFLSSFAERHTDVEDLISEEDRIVARHTHHVKHVNEVFGIAPTGKQLTVWGIDIFRFENGKIAEWWTIDDNLGMMQQLGAIPEPGQPEESPPPGRPG